MRRGRRWFAPIAGAVVVSAATFVAVVFVNSPTASADPPTPPYTAVVLDGLRGTRPLVGTLAPEVVATSSTGELVHIVADIGEGFFSATMRPPMGQVWVVGTTYETRRGPDLNSPEFALLSVGWAGSGCNLQDGTLTVHEVERDGSNVSAFAATLAVTTCEQQPYSLVGEVRWNSMVDWVAAVSDRGLVDFGNVVVEAASAPQVVTFTGKGTLPVTLGSAAVEGPNPTDFTIADDACSQATLAYDDTCTITLIANPTTFNGRSAALVIPDNTVTGEKYVRLAANGVVAPPSPPPTPSPTPSPSASPSPSPSSSPPAPSNVGTFYPVGPERVLDTRSGHGVPQAGKLGQDEELALQVAGVAGVPASGVSAVVLNVTATGPTANSFLTVYPDGLARPTVSSLNFPSGWTGANMVTVGLGGSGGVRLYNKAGNVHVIADVVGYYAADGSMVSTQGSGAHYNPIVPFREFDSRVDFGFRVPADHYVRVAFSFGIFDPHIRAVAVNVTAVSPTGNGHLRTWDGGSGELPLASTLNYTTGATVPNMAVVPVSWCVECDPSGIGVPSIGVYTSTDTHVIVDILGAYDDAVLGEGLRFAPVTPQRIADSRTGLGLPSALGAQTTGTVIAPGSIVTAGVFGLAMNVTAVTPTARSFVTVWPDSVEQPTVSNLNVVAGRTVPNSVYLLLGPQVGFHVYNHAGSVHLLADVVGTFYYEPALPSLGAQPGAGPGRGRSPSRLLVDGDYEPVLVRR